MDENEYKAQEIKWFNKSLGKRVERWKQITPATYNVPLPKLVWGYLSMMDDMYISGQFAGTIIFGASIAELILADQLHAKGSFTSTTLESAGLKRLIERGYALSILDDKETEALHNLRELRNHLIHGNVGKLTQMAKERFKVEGPDDSFLDAEFYLNFEGGIVQDALRHLKTIRDLSVRLYGEKE
ncbi:hypothetical protein ACFLU1_06295 [Chloroflexota bacterium]